MAIIVTQEGRPAAKIEVSGVPDEDSLQEFIANNPETLPIDDIAEDPRLLVVRREFPTGSGPIDILALDANGDIYIIETKLYKNPDKRKVVAQVLDYGAALWSSHSDPDSFIDAIEVWLDGSRLDSAMAERFGLDEVSVKDSMDRVRTNASTGHFRFIVLMDQIHDQLRDLVRFLNARSNFDLYAAELEFYQHEDLRIVIPKLFGAELKKPSPEVGERWNRGTLLASLKERRGNDAERVARDILDWSPTLGPELSEQWGIGKQDGSFAPTISVGGKVCRLFYLWSTGSLTLSFSPLPKELRAPGSSLLTELTDRLNEIPGVSVSPDKFQGFAQGCQLVDLLEKSAMDQFKSTVEWFIKAARTD